MSALFIVMLALAAPAVGDATEADLVRRGVGEREQGRDQAALDLFRQAYERFHTPRALAQMGLACQALGRWGEADGHISLALAASTDAWIGNNRRALEQALAVIGQHVGTLEVLSNVEGTEILVDGRLVGQLPLRRPLRLSAGTTLVQARAAGYGTSQRQVTVVAGQLARETFTLLPVEKAPVAAPPPPPAFVEAPAAREPPAPSLLERKATFIGAAAATAVVGGLAIWSGLDTLSARDRYRDEPTKERYDDGLSRQHRTNWLIGATAVLGAATAGLGLFSTRW